VVFNKRVRFVKIDFAGGLGNQLFQYATARALKGEKDLLLFDADNYKNDYLNRKFALEGFKVKGTVVSGRYVKKLFTPKTRLNQFVDALGLFNLIQEDTYRLQPNIQDRVSMFTTIRGFWQSDKYFTRVRAELLRELVPKLVPERPPYLVQKNTVAVHVRRTDYLNDHRYGFIGEMYYRNAIEHMKRSLQNPLFIFFSDDLEWCKRHFGEQDCLFADSNDWLDDHLQLYLIAQCCHQIIANSSFSWWGAWLNQNDKKIVIRPAKPFQDESFLYESHYPPEWIAI
jgi:hypothetical protein